MASRRGLNALVGLVTSAQRSHFESIRASIPVVLSGACSSAPQRPQCRHMRVSAAQMAVSELTMPSLSPTMERGNIAEWTVQEGQAFAAGDIIANVETDKATMGWESQDDGVMGKILYPAGSQDIDVGTVVALTVEDASELEEVKSYQPGSSAPAPAAAPAEPQAAAPAASGANFPPHQVWTMPALSPTMTQGNIAKWYKKVGDPVAAGDGIVEVETDKATMMWESVEEGFIAQILAADGTQDIQVGEPVVVIVEEEESVPAFSSFTAADASAPAAAPATPAAAPAPPAATPPAQAAPQPAVTAAPRAASSTGRAVSSPYARRLAREAGIPVEALQGSGPGGRIVAADVKQGVASGVTAASADGAVDASAAFTDAAVKQIQKITAKRLLESKTTVPHYYVSYECEMDSLLALRATLNKKLEKSGGKISVNDFIIKASAAALRDVPEVNASWFGDYIRQYHNVDITVAVQTPAGLMVPIVRDADLKGLQTISEEVKSLAAKAKEGKLKPEEYTGGTFAVSNLGMFGVSSFCPIINPPQAAILGAGVTTPKIVLEKDGSPKKVQTMTVTISCDHRVIDGAVAATWLQAFRKYIESPEMLLL